MTEKPFLLQIKADEYIIPWMYLGMLVEEYFGHVVETDPPDDSLFSLEFENEKRALEFKEIFDSTFRKTE